MRSGFTQKTNKNECESVVSDKLLVQDEIPAGAPSQAGAQRVAGHVVPAIGFGSRSLSGKTRLTSVFWASPVCPTEQFRRSYQRYTLVLQVAGKGSQLLVCLR